MTPQPTAPAPKRNGCLIALMVIGGIAGLICVGSSIAVFFAARSDTAQKVFSAIDKGKKLAEDGVDAPGAAELRAAGCPQSFVMDMEEAWAIADTFFDDGGIKEDPEMNYMSVNCAAPAGSTIELPTCKSLAAVYAKAVPSERSFVVSVKYGSKKTDECSQQFEGDGTYVRDMGK